MAGLSGPVPACLAVLPAAPAVPAASDLAAGRRGISASDAADTAKDTASIPKAAVE